jgi:hypothetical protein
LSVPGGHVRRATSVPERAGNRSNQRSAKDNRNSLLPGQVQVDPLPETTF